MSEQKKLKICIACSPGGHMVQAKRLKSIYEKYDYFYFTFSGSVGEELAKTNKVRMIPNVKKHKPLTWITGFILSFCIAVRERPDVVVTTGAGVVVFFCIFAKLFGGKLIFLESMAKITKPTLTAKMLYPFSDMFLVQWPGLVKFFPRAQFLGRLF